MGLLNPQKDFEKASRDGARLECVACLDDGTVAVNPDGSWYRISEDRVEEFVSWKVLRLRPLIRGLPVLLAVFVGVVVAVERGLIPSPSPWMTAVGAFLVIPLGIWMRTRSLAKSGADFPSIFPEARKIVPEDLKFLVPRKYVFASIVIGNTITFHAFVVSTLLISISIYLLYVDFSGYSYALLGLAAGLAFLGVSIWLWLLRRRFKALYRRPLTREAILELDEACRKQAAPD